MALVRWNPYREMETLQREMNRLFDSLTAPSNGENTVTDFIPPAEMTETPEAIHLRLEVPGLEPKDLDVQVTAEAIAITGERKHEARTETKGVTRTEFRYGQFRRVIPLPARVENTKVQAEYKNGILNLTLPKAEEEKNRVVKVNLG